MVMVHVERATPLVSPAYDTATDEAPIVRRWLDHHAKLADARLSRLADQNSRNSP